MNRKPKQKIEIDGSAAYIHMTGGHVAIIDSEDLTAVQDIRWCARIYGKTVYAFTSLPTRYLHRYLLNVGPGIEIDHIDGNGLNNRKSNLRICTRIQNMANRGLMKTNKSGFKGVSWVKAKQLWLATIRLQGRTKHLGHFHDPQEAANAYVSAALEAHGEFARFK